MSPALQGGFLPLDYQGSPWLKAFNEHLLCTMYQGGFPDDASGKEPTCQCKRHKRCRFDPWVQKIPQRRTWQPTPVFLPGESHGLRSLVGCNPWGHKESDVTEHAHTPYTKLSVLPFTRILV